ncbi:hypothetical protein EMIT0P12_20404 [Pseudomonas sp. IT-P12]
MLALLYRNVSPEVAANSRYKSPQARHAADTPRPPNEVTAHAAPQPFAVLFQENKKCLDSRLVKPLASWVLPLLRASHWAHSLASPMPKTSRPPRAGRPACTARTCCAGT